MSGYHEYSKSNNAVLAESSGRFSATQCSKLLKLPCKFIKEHCKFASNGEWHHSSKFYNPVEYFDSDLIRQWMNGDNSENDIPFEDVLTEFKAANKKINPIVYKDCSVTYLEWTGSRNYCRSTKINFIGQVTDYGKDFISIVSNDQKYSLKKKKSCNGLSVIYKNKPIF